MNEAELVLSEATGYSRSALYLNREEVAGAKRGRFIAAALMRRSGGEPIQYILGSADFFGLEFKVTPSVLIPRPETELLVEKTISIATSCRPQATSLKILDIGAGCGNIAISLAKHINNCEVVGVDISQDAIAVAQENALLNKVESKVNFLCLDFFSLQLTAYNLQLNSFDFVISNPPYIESVVIDTLQPEVRCEPRVALDGGKDGLDFYRRIINEAPKYLASGGYIILEIGYNQMAVIRELVKEQKKLTLVEVIRDYNNQDRILVMKNG